MKKFKLILVSVFSYLLMLFTFNSVSGQCVVDSGNDTTVYTGYAPMSCVTLTATFAGVAPITILWSNGDTTASITACNTATTTYYVTITDSTGCTSTDSVTVAVIDVRCGTNNNKVLVCHVPPGNIANMHPICISANAVAAHLAHGCYLGPCFNAPPPPPVCSVDLGNDTSFCSGNSLVLDAGAGAVSYLWSDSSMMQTLTVTASGTYSVVVADSAGCVATDTINIIVFDSPVADAGDDTTLTAPGCVDLVGSANGGTPPYTYLWSNGDTLATTNVCDSITTTYTLLVTDSNGCVATDDVVVTIDTGAVVFACDSDKVMICHVPPGNPGNAHTICVGAAAVQAHLAHGDILGPCANGNRIGQFGQVNSMPNPFSNRVTVEFITTQSGWTQLALYSLTGMEVAELYNDEAKAFIPYTTTFTPKDLPEGIYIARLVSPGNAPVNYRMILMK